MRRIIVDYKKLTNEILKMISERYPDGYNDNDIIVFRNKDNEIIEAIEVKTEDTIYLVKVGKKLADSLEVYLSNEDEDIDGDVDEVKGISDKDLNLEGMDDDDDEDDDDIDTVDDDEDEEED
ncbi:MAG TPA: DNA primase [Flavobacteriaceae bacterium]|nr:DNA primase [Flavobacteriaceae bacterium]HEX5742463.1 DNA primase [Flavobacteriaceae bacterium]